jgi:hypothetical protein
VNGRKGKRAAGAFELKYGKERLVPNGGLALVGAMPKRTGLAAEVDRVRLEARPACHIPNHDVINTALGLLAQGRTDFEAVKMLAEDDEASMLCLWLTAGVPYAKMGIGDGGLAITRLLLRGC